MTGTYVRGVPVTLTARPRAGHRFVGWSDSAGTGGVDPDAPVVQVVLTGARTITASFEPVGCTADLDGSGAVDLSDVAMLLVNFGPNA